MQLSKLMREDLTEREKENERKLASLIGCDKIFIENDMKEKYPYIKDGSFVDGDFYAIDIYMDENYSGDVVLPFIVTDIKFIGKIDIDMLIVPIGREAYEIYGARNLVISGNGHINKICMHPGCYVDLFNIKVETAIVKQSLGDGFSIDTYGTASIKNLNITDAICSGSYNKIKCGWNKIYTGNSDKRVKLHRDFERKVKEKYGVKVNWKD